MREETAADPEENAAEAEEVPMGTAGQRVQNSFDFFRHQLGKEWAALRVQNPHTELANGSWRGVVGTPARNKTPARDGKSVEVRGIAQEREVLRLRSAVASLRSG